MSRMDSATKLCVLLADNFHDRVDDDDPVDCFDITKSADDVSKLEVRFQSGNEFIITITRLESR